MAKKKGKESAIRPEAAKFIKFFDKHWKNKEQFGRDLLALDHKFYFCGWGTQSKTANAQNISNQMQNLPGFFLCVGSPLVASPFLVIKLGNRFIQLEGIREIKAYISKISKRAKSYGLSKEHLSTIAKTHGIDPAFPESLLNLVGKK